MKRFAGYVLSVLLLAALLPGGGCSGIRPPPGVQSITRDMVTTGYCECGECCNWHRTWYGLPVMSSGKNAGKRKKVGITASGTRVHRGTIAADTARYPFGTIMYVPGYGYGRVEDRGGKIKGNHIDLYFSSHREALRWGRRMEAVKIWQVP